MISISGGFTRVIIAEGTANILVITERGLAN